jgi:hypothetical protein
MKRRPAHVLFSVFHDVKQIVRAIPTMWKYLRQQERIDCSISLFSAASSDAFLSLPTEYSLVLANDTSRPLVRKILIDIYRRHRPVHPDGHYAWFHKTFRLLPRTSCVITVTYDWIDAVRFVLNGVALSPDGFWRGDCSAPGPYAVQAVLFDAADNHAELVFIIQDLKIQDITP